jgi:hypothetical protein
MSEHPSAAEERPDVQAAMRLIEVLAGSIGPRRPTGYGELAAGLEMRAALASSGIESRLEEFRAYSTFALPQAAPFALALGAGLLPRRRRLLRSLLALKAALAASLESEFSRFAPSRLVSSGRSQSLVAEIEPAGEVLRTLCLVSHLDSSRSGLMFDPRVTPHLGSIVAVVGVAFGIQGLEPLLEGRRAGRALLGSSRALLAAAALLIAEREIRGVDVPGANDNASGVAATAVLAAECTAEPLEATRLVVLMTGGEEAGVLGMRAFLDAHDTAGWLFLNFDGVAAPASLHFLHREGGELRNWQADTGMRAVAERIEQARPELGLSGTDRGSGLPYDATPVLARGGRALTLTVQNGSIPNYHWPTDTPDRLDPEVLGRALDVGREMIRAIDSGEADI